MRLRQWIKVELMRWEAAAISSIGGSKNGVGREKSIQREKREWGSDGKYDQKEGRGEEAERFAEEERGEAKTRFF